MRTDDWKYIRYPHGDGRPDRHLAELYDLKRDPEERHNLIDDRRRPGRSELQAELARADGGERASTDHDRMPLDEGIKKRCRI